jgi:3-keto-disaccharide hydrolase
MHSTHTRAIAAGAMLLLAAFSFAAGTSEPAIADRGKLLFNDEFNGAALQPEWRGGPGLWEVANGALKGSERTEDHHAAVRRHPLQYHDAIFEFAFRFDGAKGVHLSINNKDGHVCRLIVSPKGMVLQTDKPAKLDVKPEKLATLDTVIAPGEWHKVVVEVRGKRMTAQLDGKQTISGESARVDVEKGDFGFPVNGVSASFDYVRVYEIRK